MRVRVRAAERAAVHSVVLLTVDEEVNATADYIFGELKENILIH